MLVSVYMIFTVVNYFSFEWLHWVDNRRGWLMKFVNQQTLFPSYVNESRSIHRQSRVHNDLCQKFCVSASIPKQTIISLFVCYSSQLRRLFSWMKKELEERSVECRFYFLFTIIATRKKRVKEKHSFFNETFSFSPIDGKTVFHLFSARFFIRVCVEKVRRVYSSTVDGFL